MYVMLEFAKKGYKRETHMSWTYILQKVDSNSCKLTLLSQAFVILANGLFSR